MNASINLRERRSEYYSLLWMDRISLENQIIAERLKREREERSYDYDNPKNKKRKPLTRNEIEKANKITEELNRKPIY